MKKLVLVLMLLGVVIDGDTLSLGGERWRLANVDAPEMDTVEGQEAKKFMVRLVAGKDVRCRFLYRDKYGRSVGQCFVGSKSLGVELVMSGHGRIWE